MTAPALTQRPASTTALTERPEGRPASRAALAERPTAEILEHLSTLARGATGHAAAAAALELAAEVTPTGKRRLLTLAAADAQLAGEPGRAAELL
ncbi:hypothetical protein, partial [Actinoplanes octamycinicus]